MSKLRMGWYGFLGALLSVAIWSFLGGCQSLSGPDQENTSSAAGPVDRSDSFTKMNESLSMGENIPGETLPEKSLPETISPPAPGSEVNIPVEPPGEGPPAAFRTHTVKKGDTLWGISRAYGVKMNDLKNANNLDKPDSLKIGQKLIIP